MRTTPNEQGGLRLLCKADPNQKEHHTFFMPDGTKKAIFLGSKYSEDNKVSKPTMAVAVTDCEEIKVGDVLLFTHVVLISEAEIPHEDYTGPEKLFLINKSSVVAFIRDGNIQPVGDNMICERLYYPEEVSPGGIILSIGKKQISNRLRVVSTSPEVYEVVPGDVVVTYPMSDYELIFNLDNVQQSVIRCLFSRDVIALDTEDYSKY